MKHDGIASDTRGDGALLAPIVALTSIPAGDQDAFTPLPRSEVLAAAVPNATMDVMEGCGHVMFYERPAEFNQRLSRSLAAPGMQNQPRATASVPSRGARLMTGILQNRDRTATPWRRRNGPAKGPNLLSLRGRPICKTIPPSSRNGNTRRDSTNPEGST